MQRKASKKTRAANSEERKFCQWVKEQNCVCCGKSAPSIADHVKGSAYKIKYNFVTVLVGHWYLIPLCENCDKIKTQGSHKRFFAHFGKTQREIWLEFSKEYPAGVPVDVYEAILSDL